MRLIYEGHQVTSIFSESKRSLWSKYVPAKTVAWQAPSK